MNFFINNSVRPPEEKTVTNITAAYIELQKHSVDPPGISYTYVFQWNQHSFFIATCVGRDLDALTPFIQDPKLGNAWYNFYKEKWPSWGRLMDNAINTRYSDGVLLNIEDPDNGERTWVVGTVVGNILVNSAEELEQVMFSERMMQAYALVLAASSTLANDIATRPNPTTSLVKMYARGIFQSQLDTIELGAIWIPKIRKLFG
jgi:hypothetical protein